ncbi:MAG: FAD-dependent oxidoreductase [Campylobacteraceae bacterium]|nr:FAD-dependent oxidoreductase [Campylobacteraceae bacterium]MBT3881675.1 FAD-dependent oxidoreductase [Campylobacteraceae bacterium]MBT4030991.1 FAD-dependent oxidoreductase [Campylobacteraceae bacterium]MBT4178647.1 FAD-dependent oxidoreductase [Campylobacteraceae bacterium]MBT4572524.1 FAD-dependent oxidoreductase [Campylobacteraceae bacterium]
MNIVIIGAGYGGLRAVEKLIKNKNIHITLIDSNPYHYMQTEAYGYIAGKYDICDITVDIKQWCIGFSKDIKFINEEAINIDPLQYEIETTNQTIKYDKLIIATGAKTNFPIFIDGLEENTYGVKVLDRAYELKTKFEHIIYKKVRHSGDKKFNVIIGGAGLSGVEIAAEMAYISKKFTKSSGIKYSNISIILIEAYDSILNGMDQYIINNTMKRLKSLGVDVMTKSFISSVQKDKVILQNNDEIEYDFMIFTGGIKADGLNDTFDVEKNKLNQFIVNKYLNINGYHDIYAIGDCAQIQDKNGNFLPPTSQIAEQCAQNVAKNIIATINGKKLEAYEGHIDGMFVALGGHYAVGNILNKFKVKGYLAYLLKKVITKMYHYGLILRLNNGYKLRK